METSIQSMSIFRQDIFQDENHLDQLTEEYILSYTEYNKNKKILKEEKYLSDGTIEQVLEYIYNDKGLLTDEKLFHDESEFTERKTFEYDTDGRLIKEYRHYQDEQYDTTQYQYNSLNQLTEKITFDSEGKIEAKETFEYQNGMLTKKEIYEEGELPVSFHISNFDEKGNEIETITWNAEENKKLKFVNEFNENSQKTWTLIYNETDQLIDRTFYEYTDKGSLKLIIEEDAYQKNTILLTHDENGNTILEEETNKDDQLNYRIKRIFNSENLVMESEILVNHLKDGTTQHYKLRYVYNNF